MLLTEDFSPAEHVRLEGFRLEKLAPQHAEADFAAVLRQVHARLSRDWPFRPGAVAFPGRVQGWAEWAEMASGADVCGAAGE